MYIGVRDRANRAGLAAQQIGDNFNQRGNPSLEGKEADVQAVAEKYGVTSREVETQWMSQHPAPKVYVQTAGSSSMSSVGTPVSTLGTLKKEELKEQPKVDMATDMPVSSSARLAAITERLKSVARETSSKYSENYNPQTKPETFKSLSVKEGYVEVRTPSRTQVISPSTGKTVLDIPSSATYRGASAFEKPSEETTYFKTSQGPEQFLTIKTNNQRQSLSVGIIEPQQSKENNAYFKSYTQKNLTSFEKEIYAQQLRQETFYSSPMFKTMGGISSWTTGGFGKPIEERSWIGQYSQNLVMGAESSINPLVWGGTFGMVGEKLYLSGKAIFKGYGTNVFKTYKSTFTEPEFKSQFDITQPQGAVTYTFAALPLLKSVKTPQYSTKSYGWGKVANVLGYKNKIINKALNPPDIVKTSAESFFEPKIVKISEPKLLEVSVEGRTKQYFSPQKNKYVIQEQEYIGTGFKREGKNYLESGLLLTKEGKDLMSSVGTKKSYFGDYKIISKSVDKTVKSDIYFNNKKLYSTTYKSSDLFKMTEPIIIQPSKQVVEDLSKSSMIGKKQELKTSGLTSYAVKTVSDNSLNEFYISQKSVSNRMAWASPLQISKYDVFVNRLKGVYYPKITYREIIAPTKILFVEEPVPPKVDIFSYNIKNKEVFSDKNIVGSIYEKSEPYFFTAQSESFNIIGKGIYSKKGKLPNEFKTSINDANNLFKKSLKNTKKIVDLKPDTENFAESTKVINYKEWIKDYKSPADKFYDVSVLTFKKAKQVFNEVKIHVKSSSLATKSKGEMGVKKVLSTDFGRQEYLKKVSSGVGKGEFISFRKASSLSGLGKAYQKFDSKWEGLGKSFEKSYQRSHTNKRGDILPKFRSKVFSKSEIKSESKVESSLKSSVFSKSKSKVRVEAKSELQIKSLVRSNVISRSEAKSKSLVRSKILVKSFIPIKSKSKVKTVGFQYTPPNIKVFGFGEFKSKYEFEKKLKKSKKPFGRSTLYVASVRAGALGIYGKMPKLVSNIGLRPLIK